MVIGIVELGNLGFVEIWKDLDDEGVDWDDMGRFWVRFEGGFWVLWMRLIWIFLMLD